MSHKTEVVPSHKCTTCGALWRLFRKGEHGATTDGWALKSSVCGKCCDNREMGEQIVPLTFGDMEDIVRANIAVAAFERHVEGKPL